MDDEDGPNCLCKDGFGRDSISDLCSSCHENCLTCSGLGPDQCTSCQPNTVLIGSAPSACECAPGFFTDGGVDECESCTAPCKSCNSGRIDDCDECYDNASLNFFNECNCDFGYILDYEDYRICHPCHPTCLECFGPGPDNCISCKEGAYRTEGDTCECNEGDAGNYVGMPDSSNCQYECAFNCSSCTDGPFNCDVCTDGRDPVDGFCGCAPGYTYARMSAGDPCTPSGECHYTCTECFGVEDPNGCTACQANASLRSEGDYPSYCDCDEGYGPSVTAANCTPNYYNACNSECATCPEGQPDVCITCKEGAELLDDGVTCSCLP